METTDMMFDLWANQSSICLAACCVIAIAAMFQSMVGFGFNLMAVPILTLLLSPKIVVPVILVSWIPIGLILMFGYRRKIHWPRVVYLIIAAVPGLVLGTWLLAQTDNSTMKRFIGIVAIFSGFLLILKNTTPFRLEKPWLILAGISSGILGGSTAMSGPPVVLLGLHQSWEPSQFRIDLISYFTLVSIVMVIPLTWQNLLLEEQWTLIAIGSPGLIGGLLLGIWLAPHISPKYFRWIVFGLLSLAGLMPWIINS